MLVDVAGVTTATPQGAILYYIGSSLGKNWMGSQIGTKSDGLSKEAIEILFKDRVLSMT